MAPHASNPRRSVRRKPLSTALATAVGMVVLGVVPSQFGPSASAQTHASAAGSSVSATRAPALSRSGGALKGKTVVIDPGLQLGNRNFKGKIGQRVPAGGFRTRCDSVGASTRTGYPAATITWHTATLLKKRLQSSGARVVMTRNRNTTGRWGPCVNTRGTAGNAIHADIKISLAADSSSPKHSGFKVVAPADHRPTTHRVFSSSQRLAQVTSDAMSARGLSAANYGRGNHGMFVSGRLAVLNLSKIPAVSVSLGNVRNSKDARRMSTAKGQSLYASSVLDAARAYFAGGKNTASSASTALGVQVFAMWRDWDNLDALLDQVVASGSRWIRVDVGWCSLEESGPGQISQWYQDRLDTVVAAAQQRHLSLLFTLSCAPDWADGSVAGALPSDPQQFARIAGYLAGRYRGAVAAWEVWNEPDCIGGCPNGDPVAYANLLKAAYPSIKAADPNAIVMNGGLSGINMGWIKRMYAAGAGKYLDALAVHPYLAPAAAAPATAFTQNFSNPYRLTNVAGLHKLLKHLGHRKTPIWFTEFGWTTGSTPGSPYDGVSPDVQAQYLTQAVHMIRTDYPYVKAAFWYMLRDRDDSSAFEDGFGLLNTDGSPKPAYTAFQQAMASTRK